MPKTKHSKIVLDALLPYWMAGNLKGLKYRRCNLGCQSNNILWHDRSVFPICEQICPPVIAGTNDEHLCGPFIAIELSHVANFCNLTVMNLVTFINRIFVLLIDMFVPKNYR